MKIGFFAMSGVRVRDEELLALGLTLPGFVERSKVIASLPSLGLLTLAGMSASEFELDYREVDDWMDLDLDQLDHEAVALSSFSAQILETYALADALRARGIQVILGGLHVTALPEEAMRHADAVVVGEGEPVWQQVLQDLSRGRLRTLYDARPSPFDLRQSPMPQFDLLDIDRYNRLTVQTHRGCPIGCDFCAASLRISPVYKVKPVERVMAEIDAIKSIWPHPFIEFADDNTFVNKQHGRELCRALASRRVRWFTETDISVAEDPELLELMAESGCAQVLIGLESPQTEVLGGIARGGRWKQRKSRRYLEAIRRIQDHGITVNGCFILGLDHTGTESFDAIWEFIQESQLYEVQLTVMTPFPGTPLYHRLKEAGRLTHDGMWDRCTLFDVNFEPTGMAAGELRAGLMDLGQRVYSKSFTETRRRRFVERKRRADRVRELSPAD